MYCIFMLFGLRNDGKLQRHNVRENHEGRVNVPENDKPTQILSLVLSILSYFLFGLYEKHIRWIEFLYWNLYLIGDRIKEWNTTKHIGNVYYSII